MSGVAERQRELGNANRRAILRELAATDGDGLKPGKLTERTGLGPSIVRRHLGALVADGLVERASRNGRAFLTSAGRAAVSTEPKPAVQPGIVADPNATLAAVLAALPEPHAAMVRLMLATIVARWHLAKQLTTEWLTFLAYGEPGTGKTLLARVICRLLGLDEDSADRDVTQETRRSLFGWRNANGRFHMAQPPGNPFLGLKELHKLTRGRLNELSQLFQGETAITIENERITLRATIYVTSNHRRLNQIPADLQRRAVVFSPADHYATEIEEAADQLLADEDGILPPGGPAVISLDEQQPPVAALSREGRERLAKLLDATLNDEGRRLTDRARIGRTVLGYLSFGLDEEAAIELAAADVATVAATVGWTETEPAQPDESLIAKRQARRLAAAGERGAIVGQLQQWRDALIVVPGGAARGYLDGVFAEAQALAGELEPSQLPRIWDDPKLTEAREHAERLIGQHAEFEPEPELEPEPITAVVIEAEPDTPWQIGFASNQVLAPIGWKVVQVGIGECPAWNHRMHMACRAQARNHITLSANAYFPACQSCAIGITSRCEEYGIPVVVQSTDDVVRPSVAPSTRLALPAPVPSIESLALEGPYGPLLKGIAGWVDRRAEQRAEREAAEREEWNGQTRREAKRAYRHQLGQERARRRWWQSPKSEPEPEPEPEPTQVMLGRPGSVNRRAYRL